MEMTNKELHKFALAELRKRRPRVKEWELSGNRREVNIDWENDIGTAETLMVMLPTGMSLSNTNITATVNNGIRRMWPRLADWTLIDDHTMRIVYTFWNAEIAAIEVDLPRDEPEAPPVADDGAEEENDEAS